MNTDKGINFELEGYELRYISRQNKGGGGVALYVGSALKLDSESDSVGQYDNSH